MGNATSDGIKATSLSGSSAWWLAALACVACSELVVLWLFETPTRLDPASLLSFGLLIAIFGGAWLPVTNLQNAPWPKLFYWHGGFTAFFCLCATVQFNAPFTLALKLTVGVSVMLALCCALNLWFARGDRSPPQALVPYLCLFTGLVSAPLYLSPVAELMTHNSWVGNMIIAISPYSYLASWIEHDYLRDPWFYQNTSYGGLRFSYPSALTLSAIYLAVTALLFTLLKSSSDGKPRHSATTNQPNVSPNFGT